MSKWDELESYQTQEDLIEWYNVSSPSDEDKEMLADLFNDGQFSSWTCPACGTQCLVGNPDSWDSFQGASQSETLGELCQSCAGEYLRLKEFADE